jgi:hypothetical protein
MPDSPRMKFLLPVRTIPIIRFSVWARLVREIGWALFYSDACRGHGAIVFQERGRE